MNLSFAGCGFLGIYHVGVASCFREYAPHILVNKIAGASVGSIAAAALICDVSLGQTTTDILNVAGKARARPLGPLNPRFDLNKIVKENLVKSLPKDAHIRCTGRLFISVTQWPAGKNAILSEFSTRDELIQALLCSCFIPLYSGMTPPTYRGETYADGGLSNNLPVLDENTISVSPFAGEHDIAPQDDTYNPLQITLVNTNIEISASNLYRFCRILFPPHPEILSEMCKQGFDDALRFLQRRNLIACTRCLGVQSSLSLTNESDSETNSEGNYPEEPETDPNAHTGCKSDCSDCREKQQLAILSSLPEAIQHEIRQACDTVNKGIVNWFRRRTAVKILSYFSMPYALSLDLAIAIFQKIYDNMPEYRKELLYKSFDIINLIAQLTKKLNKDTHLYSAKFSCQLAVTEFDYTEDNVVSSYSVPLEKNPPQETCVLKTEEEKTPKRKLSTRKSEYFPKLSSVAEKRQQRKSYAGFSSSSPVFQETEKVRRKSLSEISHPERVIRNMNFGFKVDLTPSVSSKDKKMNVVEALQSLNEEDNDLNVMELTSKALSLEREVMAHHQNDLTPENVDTLGKILNASKNEAVLSYYYVDDDNSVNITELYNVTDADSSIVLPDEEREVNNQLQWDKDWIHMHGNNMMQNISITDTLDDNEFDTSDNECNLSEKNTSGEFSDISGIDDKSNKSFIASSPRRKRSFIIVK